MTHVPTKQVRGLVAAVLLLALALLPAVATALEQPFYVTLGERVLVYALAATGLNLVLGYGGMVSFGHALYVGIGAYVVGILASYGILNGWLQVAVVLVLCAVVALLTGLICLRTSGIAFIMITLAFAQMGFFVGVSLKPFGGDDGLQIASRSDFAPLSIATNTSLYYVSYVLLLVVLYLSRRLVHARFGRALIGARMNPQRMLAIGVPILRYRLVAYVVSACICGLAGLLLANLTAFTSPSYLSWTLSGDLIVMVMLGGIASLIGPLVGAMAYVLLETISAGLTQHWMLLLGVVILLTARFANRGLYGRFVG
jgi:branched-chain amino acid transport system permease protein